MTNSQSQQQQTKTIHPLGVKQAELKELRKMLGLKKKKKKKLELKGMKKGLMEEEHRWCKCRAHSHGNTSGIRCPGCGTSRRPIPWHTALRGRP